MPTAILALVVILIAAGALIYHWLKATSRRFEKWTLLHGLLAWWLAVLWGLAVLSAPGFWFLSVGWSFLLMPFVAAMLACAGALVIGGLIAAWRVRRPPKRAIATALTPPGVVIVGLAAFMPIVWGSTYVMTCGVLLQNHTRYERVARQVAQASRSNAGPILDEELSDGTVVYAERGAPHRIIFELTGWTSISSGILYDPTGMAASGPPIDDENIGPCLPMPAGYYSCTFDNETD